MLKKYLTEAFLKTAIRKPSQFNLSPKAMRLMSEQMARLLPVRKDVQIRSLRIAGIQAEEIKPQSSATQLIFHIHGGAFFLGSLNTHRSLMTEIAARTQMQVLHVDYPLAPEYGFPDAIDAIYKVYQELLDQGVKAKDIIVSGDSCGANLALALCLRLKEQDFALPSGLILLSPFLDLTLSADSLKLNRTHDALLSFELLETGIDYYIGQRIASYDPQVSPLFGDLKGLPPVLVQVGSKEILLDDAKRFHEQAKMAHVKVDYRLYTGMWHNFQMFYPWFEEARQAIADLSDFAHRLDRD